MFKAIVGWINNFFNFVEVEQVSSSETGYKFEHDEIKRIIKRLKNFDTVQITDAYGSPLTSDIIDKRYGADGGIDCVIKIIAPTEKGAKIVAGKIRNILISRDY